MFSGVEAIDAYSERIYGAQTFAAFDPDSAAHRAAAIELHDRLIAVGFGPDSAAALFKEREIAEVRVWRAAILDAFVLPHDDAGLAARFFVLHEVASENDLLRVLGTGTMHFLVEMAAIVRTDGGWRSLVSTTWFGGRLILSDARVYNAVWPGFDPPPDYVMPPGRDSIGLLRVAPRVPRRATLDVCCGAGAQALAATEYSERVVGVDLNPRALRFARVNAAANRIDRVMFVASDCYEALGDERFDAILSNPPFVPWPSEEPALFFRGGGPRGDAVIARILGGAIERLDPDGTLAIVGDFTDTESLPWRILKWQGCSRHTLILLQERYDLVAYAESHAGHLPQGPLRERLVAALLRHYTAQGIAGIDFGYVVQAGTAGSAQTVRTGAAQTQSLSNDAAAWFAHQRRLDEPSADAQSLTIAPGLKLVCETIQERGREPVVRYLAIGAPDSVLGGREIGAAAYEVLVRLAERSILRSEFVEESEAAELAYLLDWGLVRFET